MYFRMKSLASPLKQFLAAGRTARHRPSCQLQLEVLEDRVVPAFLKIIGGGGLGAQTMAVDTHQEASSTTLLDTSHPLSVSQDGGKAEGGFDLNQGLFTSHGELTSPSVPSDTDLSANAGTLDVATAQNYGSPLQLEIAADNGELTGDPVKINLAASINSSAAGFGSGEIISRLSYTYNGTPLSLMNDDIDPLDDSKYPDGFNDTQTSSFMAKIGDTFTLSFLAKATGDLAPVFNPLSGSFSPSFISFDFSVSFSVEKQLDLAATDLHYTYPGQVSFSYAVTGADVPDTAFPKVSIYWASGTTKETILGDPAYSQSMEKAKKSTDYGPFTVNIDFSAAPDDAKYLLAFADSGNVVTESNKDNNVFSLILPDLQAVSLGWQNSGGGTGAAGASFDYKVLNKDLPVDTTVGFYWSDTADLDDAQVKQLAVSKSVDRTMGLHEITLTSSELGLPVAKTKYLVAALDPTDENSPVGVLGEFDETNNDESVELPDLEATSLVWQTSPDAEHSGGGVILDYEVLYGDLLGDTKVGFYWSNTPTPDFTDLQASGQILLLAAMKDVEIGMKGHQVTVTAAELGIPPKGAAYIVAALDPPSPSATDGNLTEFDESNNTDDLKADGPSIVSSIIAEDNNQGKDVRSLRVINETLNQPVGQIEAEFRPAGGALTIAQARILAGVNHFNWRQNIVLPQGWKAYNATVDLQDIRFIKNPENGLDIIVPDPLKRKTDLNEEGTWDWGDPIANGYVDPVVQTSRPDKIDFTAVQTPDGIYSTTALDPDVLTDSYPFYWDEGDEVAALTTNFALRYVDKPSIGAGFSNTVETKFITTLVGVDEHHLQVDVGTEGATFTWGSNGTRASFAGENYLKFLDPDNKSPLISGGVTGIGYQGDPLNHIPQLDTIGEHSVNQGQQLSFTAIASDQDAGQTLTFSLDVAPPGATIDPNTGQFSWTPSQAQGAGDYPVTVQVTDNGSPALSAVQTFTITVRAVLTTHFSVKFDPKVVKGNPLSILAGKSFHVTVRALDGNEQVDDTYVGTINLSSNDAKTVGLPKTITFQSSDNGQVSFLVTLKTAGKRTISVADAGNSALHGAGTVTVTPGKAVSFKVSGFPTADVAGVSHSFIVAAVDSFGNTDPTFTGTVHFTSNDKAAVLPKDFAFKSANKGSHTFKATLKTTGTRSITATYTLKSKNKVVKKITGSESGIHVAKAHHAAARSQPVGAAPNVAAAFNLLDEFGASGHLFGDDADDQAEQAALLTLAKKWAAADRFR